jgi:hypothetical protein
MLKEAHHLGVAAAAAAARSRHRGKEHVLYYQPKAYLALLVAQKA